MVDKPIELMLALSGNRRGPLALLFALDAQLARIVATTREPMMGQLRLAWWRDSLVALDTSPAPAEPILRDIADRLLPMGIRGADLAGMTEGWESILASDGADGAVRAVYADRRGSLLFAAAARVMGADGTGVAAAARGWALADLSRRSSLANVAMLARVEAIENMQAGIAEYWPAAIRPLGTLAMLAIRDIGEAYSGWGRIGDAYSFLKFNMTGRR
ncbi:MAG: hypothetical protein OSB00_12345 [Sphingomonas bacterium]|nr:hypothetical protein [Sphingomonas bacterium]